MADDHDEADLFAIPEFWRRSTWQQELSGVSRESFFHVDIGGENVPFFLGPSDDLPDVSPAGDGFFQIPSLLAHAQPESASASNEHPPPPALDLDADDGDPWLCLDAEATSHPLLSRTWSSFQKQPISPSSLQPTPLFASEQGPDLVDALVAAFDDGRQTRSLLLDPRRYGNCLLALALGRSSMLFSWDDDKQSFVPAFLPSSPPRVPGLTSPLLRSVERSCLACGTHSRTLRQFVDDVFSSSSKNAACLLSQHSPCRAALARAVDRVLLTIQTELVGSQKCQGISTLLQLQARLRPVATLVQYMTELVSSMDSPSSSSPSSSSSSSSPLTALFQQAQAMEHGPPPLREVSKQVLQMVSEPWLRFTSAWIGLDPQSRQTASTMPWAGDFEQGHSFVHVKEGEANDGGEAPQGLAGQAGPGHGLSYHLDRERMPAFVPEEMAQALFETGRNLRFLWAHHPDHPLSSLLASHPRPPPLRWQFDWGPITDSQRAARTFESRLAEALRGASSSAEQRTQTRSQTQPPPDETPWRLPALDDRRILLFPGAKDEPSDRLEAVVRQYLSGATTEAGIGGSARRDLCSDQFSPPWSLLPLLSFGPLVAAQTRIVSRACMQLLFSAHGLREHLRVQQQFQLLGNGTFCSRLSHVLFDADTDVVDLATNGPGSSNLGLHLSDRENWPPASSELRLALMGLLTDSYSTSPLSFSGQLPGAMSFAVRQLPPEEMERCMDPDALEALDFLQLSYTPPAALAAILTPTILDKYDRVFRLLLRVLRVYFVANQLSREAFARSGPRGQQAGRFRLEVQHFVSSIMAYFLDMGVGMSWQRFDGWLDGIEAGLSVSSSSSLASPDRLRERHEQTLDEILAALFLRKRQQPLLALLEDIFRLVLEFAKISRKTAMAKATDNRQDTSTSISGLYVDFRKKVGVFLTVCRGLGEKEANSAARRDQKASVSPLSSLLLMLDFNGAFSAGPDRTMPRRG